MKIHIFAAILVVLVGLSFSAAITGCTILNNSASLANNVSGANISASPAAGSACIKIAAPNVVFDCNGYTINGTNASNTYAILLNLSATNVTIKNCPKIYNYDIGVLVYNSSGNTIVNITSFNNTNSNTGLGFRLLDSSNNVVANCTSFNNPNNGFTIRGGGNNSFTGNTVFGNGDTGFLLDTGTSGNVFVNNSAYNNNLGRTVDRAGFIVSGAPSNSFTNDTAFNNGVAGFFIIGSNNTLLVNECFYHNDIDFIDNNTGATAAIVNFSQVIFDNPAGSMQNFSVISLNDSAAAGTSYSINWSAQPSSLPSSHKSFGQTFANISTISGPVTIDSISWTWAGGNLTGYDETHFELWKYNSTANWTNMNATLNLASHTLNVTNLNPASVFGVLQLSLSCPIVNTSYTLAGNLYGATNNASETGAGNLACVKIAASNLVFNCNGYSITDNGTLATTYGILVNGSHTNITIKNCPQVSNYYNGVAVTASNNVTITNVTAFNDSIGFSMFPSSLNNSLTGDTAHDNYQFGFYITSGSNLNVLTNDIAYNNPAGFALILNSNGNVFSGDQAYNNSNYGFSLYQSSGNKFTSCAAYSNTVYGFIVNATSANNSLTNNTAFDNGYANFDLSSSNQNNLTSNNATNTVFTGNYDFYLLSSNNNNLTNNIAQNNNGGTAIYIASSSFNTLSGNNASNCNNGLFTLLGGASNNLTNNNANNGYAGFTVESGSSSNNFVSNNASGDTIGFYLWSGPNNFVNNRAYNSPQYGVLFYNGATGNQFWNTTLYGNGYDIYANSSTAITYNMTNTTFLNPSGTLVNYTVLSINDTLGAGEAYSISWSSQPAIPPGTSFAQKFIGITPLNGSVSLDSVVWSWQASEVNASYNESMFGVWKYSSGVWSNAGATLNTSAHTLSASGLSPSSVYGILQAPPQNCVVANTSYKMSNNFIGAPNSASPLTNFTCVKISASNIVFDCNGFSILNNGTPGFTYGILVPPGFTNVTIKNCQNISGYYKGIMIYQANNNYVINNTVSNNTYSGISITADYYESVINNTALNNTLYGFEDSLAGGNNNYTGNVAHDNGYDGFVLSQSTNDTLFNNSAYNNTNAGFVLSSSSHNTLSSDVENGYGKSSDGITLSASSNNTLIGNSVSNNVNNGFHFNSNANGNNLTSNSVSGFSSSGFFFDTVSNNYLTANTANNVTQGFAFGGGSNNTFISNNASNDTYGFFIYSGENKDTLTGNTANNSQYGFYLFRSPNNSLTGNIVYKDSLYGVYLQNATGSVFRDTTIYNDGYDVYVDGTSGAFTYNMTNTTFLNPSGTLANYTSLSIYDSVASSELYVINWSSQPAALPHYMASFAQKFVSITPLVGTPSIDSISWAWQPGEITAFTAPFQLWKYNASGWTSVGSPVSPTAYSLAVNNLVPGSVYGILQAQNCPVVNSSFTMNYSFIGAPEKGSPIANWACVVINASNLVFDCNGHSITNNGTANSIGILLNGSITNVTVKNCHVSSYSYSGYYLYNVDHSVFTDDIVENITNGDDGFDLDGSSFNNFTRINSTNNPYDFWIWVGSSNNNTVLDSWLIGGVTTDDVADVSGSGNVFRNITSYSLNDTNSDGAFYVSGAFNTTFDGITLLYTTADGFYFTSSSADNVIENSNINGSAYGVDFRSGTARNSIVNSAITGNFLGGVYFTSASGTMSGNTISGNSGKGVYVFNSSATMSGDRFYNNAQDLNVTLPTFGQSFNATAVIFDNPSGNWQYYTNLSLTDIPFGGSYGISWSPAPALPPGYMSFNQKFINITESGSPFLISSLIWHWSAGEAIGYNPPQFSLWQFNGTWSLMNSSPDTSANALADKIPAVPGAYGILYNGTYTPPAVPPSSGGGGALKHYTITATEVCPGNKIDVYAYTTLGALDGANVRDVLSNPYEGLITQAKTDSTGHVTFVADTEGGYTFSSTKIGYANPSDVGVAFTFCPGEAPPKGNVTPPQPPPKPPSGNVTPPTNVTQPPANPIIGQAQAAITAAQSAISDARAAGKDASGASSLLAQAQAAFDAGNYQQALDLANKAKQLALNAAAPVPPVKPPVKVTPTPTPAVTPAANPCPLSLILIGAVILIAVAAGAYMLFGQKKGKK